MSNSNPSGRCEDERALRSAGRAFLVMGVLFAMLYMIWRYDSLPESWKRSVAVCVEGTLTGQVAEFRPDPRIALVKQAIASGGDKVRLLLALPDEANRLRMLTPVAEIPDALVFGMDAMALPDGGVMLATIDQQKLVIHTITPEFKVQTISHPRLEQKFAGGALALVRDGDSGVVAVFCAKNPDRVLAMDTGDGSIRWERPMCPEVPGTSRGEPSILLDRVRHPRIDLFVARPRVGPGYLVLDGSGAVFSQSCEDWVSSAFAVSRPEAFPVAGITGVVLVSLPQWVTFSEQDIETFVRTRAPIRDAERVLAPMVLFSTPERFEAPPFEGFESLLPLIDASDLNGTGLLLDVLDTALWESPSYVLGPLLQRNRKGGTHLLVGSPTRRQPPVHGAGGDELLGTPRGVLVPALGAYAPAEARRSADSKLALDRMRRAAPLISYDSMDWVAGRPFRQVDVPPGTTLEGLARPLYSLGYAPIRVLSIERSDGMWLVAAIPTRSRTLKLYLLDPAEWRGGAGS